MDLQLIFSLVRALPMSTAQEYFELMGRKIAKLQRIV